MKKLLLSIYLSLRTEWQDHTRYVVRRPLLLLLGLAIPILVVLKNADILNRPSPLDAVRWTGRVGAITGVVAKHPDARLSGCVYTVDAESGEFFDDPREETALQGQLLLHVVRSTTPTAMPGDRLRFVGRVQKPATARLPGTFDYESYLENQGLHAMIFTSSASVRNLGPSGKFLWGRWGWQKKQKILSLFTSYLSPDEATVLAGLAIGVRPRFHPEIKRVFTESGTMHVLVASGSNVAFVVLLFISLFRLVLRIPKNISLILSLGPVAMYVLIVGSDAPIVRAGLMAAIAIGAYVLMREDSAYHALAISALVILFLSPSALFDVGFQMSFVTVFGLVHFLSFGMEWADHKTSWRIWMLRLVLSTLTAQLWLIPITTNVFHQFFPVGLLANIVMLPLAAAGLPAALLVAFVPTLVHHYLAVLIGTARFFSDAIGKTIWVPSLSALAILGFYLCCLFVRHVQKSWLCRVGCGLGAIILILGLWPKNTPTPSGLKATWIDLGRDIVCLLQTEENQNVLINTGRAQPSDSTQRTLLPFLTSQGVRSLDALVLTRTSFDRVAGFVGLYRSINIKTTLTLPENHFIDVGNLRISRLPNSKRFGENAALLVEYNQRRLVLSDVLSLASQEALLARDNRKLDVLQSRFSAGVRWREDFVKEMKPKWIVDTGPGSSFRPCAPPWDVDCVVPQQLGWYSAILNEVKGLRDSSSAEADSE